LPRDALRALLSGGAGSEPTNESVQQWCALVTKAQMLGQGGTAIFCHNWAAHELSWHHGNHPRAQDYRKAMGEFFTLRPRSTSCTAIEGVRTVAHFDIVLDVFASADVTNALLRM